MTTIPWWHPMMTGTEAAQIESVLESGFPNDGEVTDRFAARIAQLAGREHGVAVTSGTAALFCALKAAGVGPGDEVIVPCLTFIATVNAIAACGAVPVLVDVQREHLGIDPTLVEKRLSSRTKAVVPVLVNGRAGALRSIIEIADGAGVAVIVDAAEALGSLDGATPLASFGDAACLSFAPTKLVTTGQGGVVVTDDTDMALRLRQLKDHGRSVRGTGGDDDHPVFGMNFKLTNIQAAVGLAQLEQLEQRIDHQAQLRQWYLEELQGLGGIEFVSLGDSERAAWLDVLVDHRDRLVRSLDHQGIECRAFWKPVSSQPPYREADSEFPQATWLSARGVWLPSALSLSRSDVARVGSAVRAFLGDE